MQSIFPLHISKCMWNYVLRENLLKCLVARFSALALPKTQVLQSSPSGPAGHLTPLEFSWSDSRYSGERRSLRRQPGGAAWSFFSPEDGEFPSGWEIKAAIESSSMLMRSSRLWWWRQGESWHSSLGVASQPWGSNWTFSFVKFLKLNGVQVLLHHSFIHSPSFFDK